MASYFVPNLGPLVYMTPVTEAWAERIGKKVERREFADLDAARLFARHVFSRVEEEKGKVVWDSRPSAALAAPPAAQNHAAPAAPLAAPNHAAPAAPLAAPPA